MALTDQTMKSIRETLSKTFGSQNKIVIAPCMVDVYLSKTKDLLSRSVGDGKWRLIARGVLGLVYDLKNRGQKIRVCLVSASSVADLVWQETVVAFTTVRSPHPSFHTFNSTRNLYEQIGLLYENKCVAQMVFEALSVFTKCPTKNLSQGREDRSRPARSKSFTIASRVRSNNARQASVERCTVAFSNVEVQQAFSTMQSTRSEPLEATVCQKDTDSRERKESVEGNATGRRLGGEFGLETVFENIDINLNVIPDFCDRPMTTDLCTTEL